MVNTLSHEQLLNLPVIDDDIRRIIRFIPTVLSERWNQIKFELELERKRNGFVGTDENYVLD